MSDPDAGVGLGPFLQGVRHQLGLSLRDVERKTERRVHNAYLSQIERGSVRSPSVQLLEELSRVYGIDFWQLMHIAGWVPAQLPEEGPLPEPTAWDLLPKSLFDDLTADEVDDVIDYIGLLKRRRRRRKRLSSSP